MYLGIWLYGLEKVFKFQKMFKVVKKYVSNFDPIDVPPAFEWFM